MKYSRIIGTGSYLPEKTLTNLELENMVDTTDEWIVSRTGIKSRHIAAKDETSASMGTVAAKRAMEMAEVNGKEIDFIVVGTSTPDKIFPSTACLIQEQLGLSFCPAFDVNAACAGFNYALGMADQFIRSGSAKVALVIGSEVMSRIIDWQDRSTCILFADGAGAVLLKGDSSPGIHSIHLHADGNYKDLLYTPHGSVLEIAQESPYMKMQGSEVFKIAVKKLGEVVEEALEVNQLKQGEIDWLIPHQANLRIIAAVAKRLHLPLERVIITIERHGNTSAASIPLALDEAVRDGRVQPGDKLLLEGFGGGFAWGAALVTY
jgi:3-oxoacyl-[acyl-carrier-protein] synthase III